MKHLSAVLAATVMLLSIAMPSISSAQYNEERLDKFLNEHQKVKAYLVRNPNLIYDKSFREQHSELQEFMQNNPQIWGKLANNGRWGAYGPDHHWHEADWWREHDPNWVSKNHPEWAR